MVTAMKEKNKLNVVRVKLVEDIPLYSDKIVESPNDAVDILKKELSTYDREVFGIINLNTKCKVLNFNIVSVGTLNSAEAHPRETLKTAILSNAASFIAVHNHPSGVLEPSLEDLKTTQRLYEAGKIIGIKMLDHIIVADKETFSFAENDLMEKSFLEASLILGLKENPLEYNKDIFKNKNGVTYNILAKNKNNALLQNQSTKDYIVAKGIDYKSMEWEHGNYFGNSAKDLALAAFNFAKADGTVIEKILEKISYKELFFAVANVENDRWCELTEEQKEVVYEKYIYSDKYTSILDQYLLEQLDEYIEDALNFKEEINTDNFLLNKNDKEIEFEEGEHTMINEKYGYEDFEKMVKLAALEDYKYSYNEMQGAHQFTNSNNDECIEVYDYSTADGKPDNWDGDVHSDWNKICKELVEEFSGIVPGIHKKEEVWNLSDAESNKKSEGLNPIEKAEEMEF